MIREKGQDGPDSSFIAAHHPFDPIMPACRRLKVSISVGMFAVMHEHQSVRLPLHGLACFKVQKMASPGRDEEFCYEPAETMPGQKCV